MRVLLKVLLAALLAAGPALAKQPVLIISVDGMDQRYLTDCDAMGLKIPNLRRLMREGEWSAGTIGVIPTVTWPSHTTLITGVEPLQHGILANSRPASEGGGMYESIEFLKVRSLLDAAHDAGLKTAAIYWPVTVGATIDFNLPNARKKYRSGQIDLSSVSAKANPPDLVDRISAVFPSFRTEWMTDRTRTLAARYILRAERPDLMLLHLADHDGEGHEQGPFTPGARATLEWTDELIGTILPDLPPGMAVVVVSDHGFEKWDREVNLGVVARQRGVKGLRSLGHVAVADDAEAAALLAELRKDPQYAIGRDVPKDELQKYAPELVGAAAVVEPAPYAWFGSATTGSVVTKPDDLGRHGHWPTRYRAAYLVWGPGITARRMPEFSMKDVAGRIADLLGIPFTPGVARETARRVSPRL